jgi:rhamnose utilization protein RhaD (predicted bifunctional aldolase and dehydrogenase)
MPSLWDDAEAERFRERYAEHGDALALRVYTSRLLGRDPTLVLHGGGNTSVKTTRRGCRDCRTSRLRSSCSCSWSRTVFPRHRRAPL